MKTTDKQIAANRRNAARSTRPVTPEGKAIASRNALKHGPLAKEIVVDTGEGAESRKVFDAILLDLRKQFNPQGPLEEILVGQIAVPYWRLRRAHRCEAGVIQYGLDAATNNYYDEKEWDGQKKHRTEEQIDAAIREEQEGIAFWEKDKRRLGRMYNDGVRLEDTYEWRANWDELKAGGIAELPDDLDDEVGTEPQQLRGCLHQNLQWSDEDIWRVLIDACDVEIV
jgi:hypothetical protein